MKVRAECIPCYLKQVINTFNQAEVPEENRADVINKVLPMVAKLDQSKTPAENSTLILHEVNELIGITDPFQKAKLESNKAVMELWPKLRQLLADSDDRLFTAFKLAVAGNVIDLGILESYDIDESIEEALAIDFAICHYEQIRDKLAKGSKVLIIGDNSGEIAFDRLLVEVLNDMGAVVTYGVKGGPVLNDATLVDAEQVGMEEVARVITNGNRYLGTLTHHCSDEFLQEMERADLIISKGQANYESLEGTTQAGAKTFFILKAKCDIVAESLGVEFGEIVLKQNKFENLK